MSEPMRGWNTQGRVWIRKDVWGGLHVAEHRDTDAVPYVPEATARELLRALEAFLHPNIDDAMRLGAAIHRGSEVANKARETVHV